MKNKVSYWALGVLAVSTAASLYLTAFHNDPYAGIEYMITLLGFLALEVALLLLVALVLHLKSRSEETRKDEFKERSKRFLLATLLVLLVGSSVCFGGGMVMGG